MDQGNIFYAFEKNSATMLFSCCFAIKVNPLSKAVPITTESAQNRALLIPINLPFIQQFVGVSSVLGEYHF
jgi:hypothetical protein